MHESTRIEAWTRPVTVGLVALGAAFCASCGMTPDEVQYRRAIKVDSSAVYEDYLRRFPDAGHKSVEVAYRLARKQDSIEGYEAFLARFPAAKEARFIQSDLESRRVRAEFEAALAPDLAPLLARRGAWVDGDWAAALVRRTWTEVSPADRPVLLALLAGLRDNPVAHDDQRLPGTKFDVIVRRSGAGGAEGSIAVQGLRSYYFRFLHFERAVIDGREFGQTAIDCAGTAICRFYQLPPP